MLGDVFEVAFGVERGHAAGPGGRDRLAVNVILHVSAPGCSQMNLNQIGGAGRLYCFAVN